MSDMYMILGWKPIRDYNLQTHPGFCIAYIVFVFCLTAPFATTKHPTQIINRFACRQCAKELPQARWGSHDNVACLQTVTWIAPFSKRGMIMKMIGHQAVLTMYTKYVISCICKIYIYWKSHPNKMDRARRSIHEPSTVVWHKTLEGQ